MQECLHFRPIFFRLPRAVKNLFMDLFCYVLPQRRLPVPSSPPTALGYHACPLNVCVPPEHPPRPVPRGEPMDPRPSRSIPPAVFVVPQQ